MTWSDMPDWLPVVASAPLAAAVAFGLKRLMPRHSINRIAVLASLPGCLIIIAFGIWAVSRIWSQHAPPGTDGWGMAVGVFVTLTTIYTVAVFVVGWATARLSIRHGNS